MRGDDALGTLPHNPCGCEMDVRKGSNPSDTAPPAVGCAVRTKEKISDAALFPDVPGNKAVQPCLARQADIRRTISFNSRAALTKFAEQ